ncbi:uncharacterized protein A1O9_10115 [Exophiala aquamarina CBS 119918]|uniref:Tetrapyrrole biosynthesis uroporphyrinogen III synthase domain-containing protein n=1 Tax=Exophiala aquamarina CBS 119918 TaxID=1182545 RepID=A0A072P0Q1_9EURO|nr:uncharacterized protein A1O9_10115 [Exophiala aquamarina CBS 119918]KEF53714.1 hypothetical protein A1O9_10115 [Exophiala aquamarina CBS 119918]
MSTPPLSSSGRPAPGSSIRSSPPANHIIPVLLLKTQSQPHDSYHDYFSTSPPAPSASIRTPAGLGEQDNSNVSSPPSSSPPSLEGRTSIAVAVRATTFKSNTLRFQTLFVPVLVHRPNTQNLDLLEDLLRSEQLAQKYGGMIFTSQRAVEAWSEVVKRVEGHSELGEHDGADAASSTCAIGVGRPVQHPETRTTSQDSPTRTQQQKPPPPLNGSPQGSEVDDDSIFPLYSVGPATSRALNTLVLASQSSCSSSPFSRLRPSVLGEHTGNGANLAEYMLSHYNGLHSRKPHTPCTPSNEQLDLEAPLPDKRGLLFLVGEQRRDIIPKTLTDEEGKLSPSERIAVHEVEVYATGTMDSFQHDFSTHVNSYRNAGRSLIVVVVFSPQGCEAMLHSLGYIDDQRRLTRAARERWHFQQPPPPSGNQSHVSGTGDDNDDNIVAATAAPFNVIIATIGPTTRDYLKDQFGFEADVCAAKPSPQGVQDGVLAFLLEKRLV